MASLSVEPAMPEPTAIEWFEPAPLLSGLRVLLVDDDVDTRDAIAAVLAECGAEVVAVSGAEDALEAIESDPPDVFVSDIAMPGMDGHQLLREIRELSAPRGTVPAIALTAFASQADRTRALLAGYQVFLPKPFDPPELVTLVASLAGLLPGA
jgi:CheY-like chemotaxis protein